MMAFDSEEIKKAVELLGKDGSLFESRIIKKSPRSMTYSGYFDNAESLLNSLKVFNDWGGDATVYITLNDIHEGCRARLQWNTFLPIKPTTSDRDITAYRLILIDLDPERPAGISSSKDEIQLAWTKAKNIMQVLSQEGFPTPIQALSGNGIHLIYKVNIPNTRETQNLIGSFLKVLDNNMSDGEVKIDTTVGNASRITKLYGTFARKGRSTQDRPHRMARIFHGGDGRLLEKKVLESFVKKYSTFDDLKNKSESAAKTTYGSVYAHGDDEWLEKWHAERQWKCTKKSGQDAVYAVACPFNEDHDGDAVVYRLANGAVGYHCHHNSCKGKKWKDYKEAVNKMTGHKEKGECDQWKIRQSRKDITKKYLR